MLRNISKVIPTSVFTTKNHTYLLNYANKTLSPSAYYYNPQDVQLPKGHQYDLFQLSFVNYDLCRQASNLRSLLKTLPAQESYNNVRSEVEQRLGVLDQTIANYSTELTNLFKMGTFEASVQSCTNFIYVLEQSNQSNPSLYKQVLLPTIKSKLSYISQQAASDLLISLEKAQLLEDKSLLQSLVSRVARTGANQECSFLGWELDAYETQVSAKTQYRGPLDQYVRESLAGNGRAALNYKLAQAKEFVKFNLLNRFFFRETRVQYQFDQVDLVEQNSNLKKALENISKKYSDIGAQDLLKNL